MSGTGWVLLLLGAGAVYLLIKSTGASYSANPLQNVLTPPPTPALPGQEWKWNGFQWTQVPAGAIAL